MNMRAIKSNIINFIEISKEKWKNSPTVQNITLVYIGDMISKIITIGTTLFLIRGLTTQDYASYIAFTSVALLFASLVGGGINSALVRFSAEYYSRTGKRFFSLNFFSISIQVLIFFLLSILVVIFPEFVSKIVLGSSDYANLITISMFYGSGILLIEVGRSMMQAEELYKRYIIILWIRNGSALLLVGALWFLGKLSFDTAAWGLAILYFIIGIIVIFFGMVGVFKGQNWINNFQTSKQFLPEFLSATSWLMAYYFVIAAMSRIDILMLTRFTSQAELAVYGVAFQYYSMAILLLGSISAVLRTKFSKIEMQNRDQQQKFLTQWLSMTVWIGIPVILFIFFGKTFFVFLNGIAYEDSFLVLSFLLIGVWFSLMLSPLTNILLGRKEFKYLFALSVIAFLVCIITNYFGVRIYGAVGAAIALIITHNMVLQLPILWKIIRK